MTDEQKLTSLEILNCFNEKLKAAEKSLLYLRQAKSSYESLIKEEQSEPNVVPDETSDLRTGITCPETKLEIKKLDNVKSIEEEIKMLQSKLEFYKELEKTKSPLEEAFKDNYGVYSNELKSTGDFDCWKSFKRGYVAAQKDYKVGEYQKTEEPKTLYQMLEDKMLKDEGAYGYIRLGTAINVVKDWLCDNTTTVTEDYSTVTLKFKKGSFKPSL